MIAADCKRRLMTAVAALSLALALFAARADFSLASDPTEYGVASLDADLSTTQAGAHADLTISIALKTDPAGPTIAGTNPPYARTRDLSVTLPPGLLGNPENFPKCTMVQFATSAAESECSVASQIGVTDVSVYSLETFTDPVYLLEPPTGGGTVARIGFYAAYYPTILDVRLRPGKGYALEASLEGANAIGRLVRADTTLWGVPAASVHDSERVTPAEAVEQKSPPGGGRSVTPVVPFMTNPTRCGVVREVEVATDSYQLPGQYATRRTTLPAITGCGSIGFNPATSVTATTSQASSGSGLDYGLDLPTAGLELHNLRADSGLKRAEVVLPEGMTVNPSEAEGLGVCSEADFGREAYDSAPNAGCPETSKIGSVTATTPVLQEEAQGSLYLAKPYENPFGALLALYMVVKIPDRGVIVTLPGRVSTDPKTGRIVTIFDEVPELPVASFKLHFREGARAPLVTPPACGAYEAISNFNPWSEPGKTVVRKDSLQIESGPDHGPCPTGGLPPFKPGLLAGTVNNAAGTFSPFNLRLTRTDSEQEITHFSIKLPPGLVAKLAGVQFCPEAGIALAKSRTGIHGGEEEISSPSCPVASQIGTSIAGSGVGSVLVYVPGRVYLAGPYHGSPLSIVAITAAKAGPFDLGTVVIREALQVNPETGEVFIDATGSDPIPHIIQGIPVHLRDIRANVDRSKFTLNPTDCSPTSTASTVLGSGLDFASEADDRPTTVSSPFQAADCAALPFKPRLSLRLTGGTKRGAHPALKAFLRMNGFGEAGVAKAAVTLPRSEFIENAHFNTICTRVQFKQAGGNGEACPPGSIYGWAKAKTPILSDPLEGPIFLRSSEHQLPDVVASLRGQEINVHLVGHVDSVKGQLRNTFETVPDAPVEWASFSFQGGKKGLFVNSTDLCRKTQRATARFEGQNGKLLTLRPAMRNACSNKGKGSASRRAGKP